GQGGQGDQAERPRVVAEGIRAEAAAATRLDEEALTIRRAAASLVRATASLKYISSTSQPMKSTRSRAHATAVLPSPVNGSIATLTRPSPCSRRHCSGNLVGKVAGCGRSRSRR